MIGFLMLVGPGEGQIATDTLFHCLRLYPESYAFIRDDATSDDTFKVLAKFASEHAPRTLLERNACPQGYLGIAVSMFEAYASVWDRHPDIEMMIELDPDTCVLRPGLTELARKKFAQFGPGMIGQYRFGPDGRRDHKSHRRSMMRDLLPLGTDQKTKRGRLGFPFYLKYLPSAFMHGYKLGEHILAALYILHGDTFRELGRRGFWQSMPPEGSSYVKMDDPLVSLGVKSVGHSLIDINDPFRGDVSTWLQFRPPIKRTAVEIVQNGYLAVHPLKRDEEATELRNEIRLLLRKEEDHR
jgi:hypothetical protein